jgi:hypothetical protein
MKKAVVVGVLALAAFVAGRYGGLTETADNRNLVVQCVWKEANAPAP